MISPLQQALTDLFERFRDLDTGEVATYIPELGKAFPGDFGIAIATVDGHVYTVGKSDREFTIQSISKPFVYGLALDDVGLSAVAAKVGVEPSGEAFNAISLEPTTGRPRNPMINAGAIATTSLVRGGNETERFSRMLDMFSCYAGRRLQIDEAVFLSERETGHRNRAIGHLLRNAGILESEVDQTVDSYFRQCSVNVTCRDLAIMAATLANGGKNPVTGEDAVRTEYVPRILSVMSTCGMYDYSGSWVFDVGIPAKSGVAGGLMAVLPGQFGVGVFSPPLDVFGNSVRGVAVCEALSREFDLHLFRPPVNVSAVIRNAYTLAHVTSKRQRASVEMLFIAEHGDSVHVLELQGPLTLSTVTLAAERAATDALPGRTIVLDLRRVASIDPAALQLLARFARSVVSHGASVVFSGLRGSDRNALASLAGVASEDLVFKDNLDAALEHCEDRLLRRLHVLLPDNKEMALREHPLTATLDEAELEHLARIAERISFAAGETVIRQGDPPDSFYLLVYGIAGVMLELSNGTNHRIATLNPGTTFGEAALLDIQPRSATVVAATPMACYRVSMKDLADLRESKPSVLLRITEGVARDLTYKLRRANEEIAALA